MLPNGPVLRVTVDELSLRGWFGGHLRRLALAGLDGTHDRPTRGSTSG